MSAMEWKTLPVDALRPAAYNPRKKLKAGDKEYEKIKNSITEFGFADPLVVNADMTIIGGHQRLTVAMELGYTEVPCAVVDIDKTREKALNIALNKITGAWDDSLLADLLKDIEDSNFDLGKTGFEPPEIETLFNKVHSKEVKEDDFDVESELKQPCFSKEGDLWHLGKHIVLCGDSTKAECYDTLMDGTKANAIVQVLDVLEVVFDFIRIHVFAVAQDDGVLDAALHVVVSVFVDARDVAGREETFLVQRRIPTNAIDDFLVVDDGGFDPKLAGFRFRVCLFDFIDKVIEGFSDRAFHALLDAGVLFDG